MNANPWSPLLQVKNPPFVLPEDLEKVREFNRKHPADTLNCKVIPIPYIGNPLAPIVLVGNIAGVGGGEENAYQARPAYIERLRKNLLHDVHEWPFFPLDPGPDTIPNHREWWIPKLQHLLDALHEQGVANAALALAQNLIAIEYFPYRSSSNRYMPGTPSLVLSQGYSIWLVRQAMKRDALIVVRYGKDKWFNAVQGLSTYKGLNLLKGIQKVHLSPKGFVDPDGFNKVVARVERSLSSAARERNAR